MKRSSVTSNLLAFAALCVVSLGFAFFLLYHAGVLPGTKNDYEVQAVVPSAVSLAPGASVKVAGLDAGRVTKIERRGATSVITFTLKKESAPVPSDSTVAIRLRSLIGENYLEVHPGKSKTDLANHGTVPQDRTSQYVEVEQILDQLKGKTRTRTRQLIRATGEGLKDRGGDLNNSLRSATNLINSVEPVSQVLDKDRVPVARLVRQFGDLTATIGQRGDQIQNLATQATTTFDAIASRDTAVGETLDAFPGTLRQVRATSATLRTLTANASPVLDGLGTVIDRLDPAIKNLKPAATSGRAAVNELGAASPVLATTLTKLQKLSGPLSKSAPDLRKTMCQVNPTVKYLAPYAHELVLLLANTASVTNFYDATGHAGRLQAMIGDQSFGGLSDQSSKVLQTILDSGIIGKVKSGGYYPDPAPGEAGRTDLGEGRVGPSDVTEKFPHIEAEC